MPCLSMGALITAALFVIPCFCNAGDQWDLFIGMWEYRQPNSAAESGYDPEGERIEIRRTDQSIKAVYFGVEREGEHGLFYSVTDVENLSMDSKGGISFTVPARRLYHERPASLEAAKKRGNDSGFTSYALHMSGTRDNSRLVVRCVSKFGNCPDDQIVFKKVPWK